MTTPEQPAFRLMRRLLPSALAWMLSPETTIRRLFDGISQAPDDARAFVDDVYDDAFPETTRALSVWETDLGLTAANSDQARRARVAAAMMATGGQSARYIQDVLRAAGFDVYVHECWTSAHVARDPRLYTNQPLLGTAQCGEDLAECGEPLASCNRFLVNDVGYLVNGRLTQEAPPAVPSDTAAWPFFLYVGGQTFPNPAFIATQERAEFEALVLRIRPAHLWVVTIVTWFDATNPLLPGALPLPLGG